MYKKLLILLFLTVNLYSQMLSMDDRYKLLYKNFEKNEYSEKLSELLSIALENRNVVKEAEKILKNSYENRILRDRLIILFVNVLYDNENSVKIKRIFDELLKDDEFKTAVVKIVKTEKNSKKIFFLLKKYFAEKFDKRFDDIFKVYLTDKFLCQTNIDMAFKFLAEKFLSKRIEQEVYNYYKTNRINDKYSDKLRQHLVSLPYDYSIDAWFDKKFKSAYKKIKKSLTEEKNYNIFINESMETIIMELIYSVLDNEEFLKEYKIDFYDEFLKDDSGLKNMLKSLIIENNDELFEKIKKKRFNCFHLNEKMFKVEDGILIFYLKAILDKKELERMILPILYESLR